MELGWRIWFNLTFSVLYILCNKLRRIHLPLSLAERLHNGLENFLNSELPWYLSYGRSKLPKPISLKQIMFQASIWVLDQPPELHSLLRSSLKFAEDDECDYCETDFQNRQFLSYWHVIHFKKILRSYWLQICNKKLRLLIQYI